MSRRLKRVANELTSRIKRGLIAADKGLVIRSESDAARV